MVLAVKGQSALCRVTFVLLKKNSKNNWFPIMKQVFGIVIFIRTFYKRKHIIHTKTVTIPY